MKALFVSIGFTFLTLSCTNFHSALQKNYSGNQNSNLNPNPTPNPSPQNLAFFMRVDNGGSDHKYSVSLVQSQNDDTIVTLSSYTHQQTIAAADISKDKEWIASGSADGELVVAFNSSTALQVKQTLQYGSAIGAVQFSPNHQYAAVGLANGKVSLLQISTNEIKEIASTQQPGGIISVHFSPNGQWLTASVPDGSATQNYSITLYQVASGKLTNVGQFGAFDSPYETHFSPNSQYIVHNDANDLQVYQFNSSGVNEITHLYSHYPICGANFSPDGKYIISGNCGAIDIYPFDGTSIGGPIASVDCMNCSDLSFSPSGKLVVARDSYFGQKSLFQFSDSQLTAIPIGNGQYLPGDSNVYETPQFSDDETQFAIAAGFFKISQHGLAPVDTNSDIPASVTIDENSQVSPDGETLFVGGYIFDVSNGKLNNVGTSGLADVDSGSSIQFSPNGRYALIWSGEDPALYDLKQSSGPKIIWQNKTPYDTNPFGGIQFSGSGNCAYMPDTRSIFSLPQTSAVSVPNDIGWFILSPDCKMAISDLGNSAAIEQITTQGLSQSKLITFPSQVDYMWLSPDQKYLMVTIGDPPDYDVQLFLFNQGNPQLIKDLGYLPATAIYSNNSDFIIVSTSDFDRTQTMTSSLTKVNLADGTTLPIASGVGTFSSNYISSDGNTIAVNSVVNGGVLGKSQSAIQIFDVAANVHLIQTFITPFNNIDQNSDNYAYFNQFSKDGKYLVSSISGARLGVFKIDPQGSKVLGTISAAATSIQFMQNDRDFFIENNFGNEGGTSKLVRIWPDDSVTVIGKVRGYWAKAVNHASQVACEMDGGSQPALTLFSPESHEAFAFE